MSEGVHIQLHVFWRVCEITPTSSSGALTPPRGGRLMYYIHSVGAKYYLVIYTGHFGIHTLSAFSMPQLLNGKCFVQLILSMSICK